MSVKTQLENELGLVEASEEITGKNVEHSLINEEITISFIEDDVEEFLQLERGGEGDVVDYQWYQVTGETKSGDEDDFASEYVIEFVCEEDDVSTYVAPNKVLDVAEGMSAQPDLLLQSMNWWVVTNEGPVGVDIRGEGWVLIAPMMIANDNLEPVDVSFSDLLAQEE